MLFTEPTFLFVFLPLLLGIYFGVGISLRNWVLLVASVIFYARGAGPFTWLVLGSIAFNYLAALAIARRQGTPAARRVLIGTVAINLVVLGVFKYAGFAVGNLNVLMGPLGVKPFAVPDVLLPISWVFFRADTLAGAVAMLGAMFGLGGAVPAVYAPAWYLNPEVLLAVTAGAIGSTPVVPRVAEWLSNPDGETGEPRMSWAASLVGVVALIGLLTASMTLSSAQTYNPFTYFRF